MKISKVAIYLRVSTDSDKNGRTQDTGMQKFDIENYLKSKSIFEYKTYEDVGISGTKKDRPALNKLLKDCKSNKISTVVIYKLDRMARSLSHLLEIINIFQENNIEFVAVKDGIDLSTAAGKLMTHILGAFGEFEAATIKERVKSGIETARSKGIRLGRPQKNGHNVIMKLYQEGKSVKDIATHTGLSRPTVYRTIGKEIKND